MTEDGSDRASKRVQPKVRVSFISYDREAESFYIAFENLVREAQQQGNPIPLENSERYTHGRSWKQLANPQGGDGEMQLLSAESELGFQDIVDGNIGALVRELETISTTFRQHIGRMLVETLEEATDRTGNTVDAKAAGGFPQAYLEMLRKIEFGVDREGNVSLPQLMCADPAAMVAQLEAQPPEFHAEVNRLKEQKTQKALEDEVKRKGKFRGPKA